MKPPMHATAARSRRCGSVSASKRPPIARNGASWASGTDLNKPPHMMWRPRFLVMAEKTEEVHHDLEHRFPLRVAWGAFIPLERAGSRLGFGRYLILNLNGIQVRSCRMRPYRWQN